MLTTRVETLFDKGFPIANTFDLTFSNRNIHERNRAFLPKYIIQNHSFLRQSKYCLIQVFPTSLSLMRDSHEEFDVVIYLTRDFVSEESQASVRALTGSAETANSIFIYLHCGCTHFSETPNFHYADRDM